MLDFNKIWHGILMGLIDMAIVSITGDSWFLADPLSIE